ncbi:Sporulation related domain-containing protein [Shimia gijangensis]|uniref:Sporulation related domain-containing protein n=1 Tax=Shimia gijangensis TaxID=1470563 RepID=A0A1M6G3B1_9RHOB|nr:SPOR domain-containing protein [Shimia gijangensis]SHJ04342.1 Sporulation related domain-containing protein [Shimia gijangensis]
MTRTNTPIRTGKTRLVAILLAATALAACEDGQEFSLFQPKAESEGTATEGQTTKLIERDVEAPDVFSVTEAGLWDGRPSLGGVWAAHPDVKDPERVIIRNQTNGKFVIGALFRRERDIPGPRTQISADAAEALGMLAGQPVELNVTALRREEVPAEPTETAAAAAAPASVEEETLDPIAAASAAVTSVEAAAKPPTQEVTSETAPAPASSSLDKPYIQIGIFSVEANAKNAADQMRSNGMVPLVKKIESKGKVFWRVLVGPASTKSERSQLMKQIKSTGFTDAYAVSN